MSRLLVDSSLRLALIVGMSAALSVRVAAAAKDDYPYLDYGAAGAGSSSAKSTKSSARKAKSKAKKSAVELPTWQQAFKELSIAPEERSAHEQATPATVSTKVEAVGSPIVRPSYELDLAFEPYRPAGRVKLSGFESYELDSLGFRPLPSLTFRWLPVKLEGGRLLSAPSSFGVYASAAYVQHPVALHGPTGDAFPETNLSTLKWQAGGTWSVQANADSPWSARLEAGTGELRVVQASSSALANHSASESFASLAIYGERRIWTRLSAFVGYDHRIPIGSGADEIELSRSNFKVGISGGFN